MSPRNVVLALALALVAAASPSPGPGGNGGSGGAEVGYAPPNAALAAQLYAQNNRDGQLAHGARAGADPSTQGLDDSSQSPYSQGQSQGQGRDDKSPAAAAASPGLLVHVLAAGCAAGALSSIV
ncbi:hypothetical protein H4R18_001396 [Coemansia javaensis]|uniref:Uncharacterized protein n=1 Tax=Coemansia javaensis TaxID=2761396 RepID=A0A9W8HHC0_9FUNG|nr:hypothetical protein H4R18_001396 [Coemansia javaensis]